jgi:DNA-binding transcriptional ArsR family regulator
MNASPNRPDPRGRRAGPGTGDDRRVSTQPEGGAGRTGRRLADASMIRALAHQARLEILDHLAGRDSATATECAEVVGLSPSATSYHLRELARHGLVREVPGQDRRERRWASTGSWYTEAGPDSDPGTQAAERALAEVAMARSDRRAREWWTRAGAESREWYDVAAFAESTLLLTPDEVASVTAAVDAALRPFRGRRAADAPPDARRTAVIYRAFPLVEPASGGDRPAGS